MTNDLRMYVLTEGVRILLRAGRCEVKFEKADGSERTMIATTNADILDLPHSESRDDADPGAPLIKCYDLEKDAWRSFRVERLLNIKPLETVDGEE